MNPIRALLWKEGREAAYKIGAGSCVAILLGFAHIDPDFPIRTSLPSGRSSRRGADGHGLGGRGAQPGRCPS